MTGNILSMHKDKDWGRGCMQGGLGKRRIRRTLLEDLLLPIAGGRPQSVVVHRDGGRVSVIEQEEEHVVEAEIPPTYDSLPEEERM